MEDFSKDGFILGEYDKEEEIRREFRSLTDWYQEEKEELIKKSELEKQQYEENTIKSLIKNGLDNKLIAEACNTSVGNVLKIKKQMILV